MRGAISWSCVAYHQHDTLGNESSRPWIIHCIYGNALHATSSEGHQEIIKLLLDQGADINVQGGFYGNALQAASLTGHQEIVKLLLEQGADINTQGGFYGNALQAASSKGHQETVKILQQRGTIHRL
ncbi:hypothetical protein N7533_013766 [Penicillium manginii]|uniref:uncharacterized protein n=1 Tax=Penicillium manginii TaxID=203109 RepID=UPI002547CACA|nr:uncharacterized protein N7533_013766 [Penicillium manginii]KAJ5733319.1 hypothetical protein N7533_013766 [Penicillium manginii]